MESAEAHLVFDIKKNEHTTSHASNVDKTENFIANQVSKSYFEIIAEHYV